MSQLGVILAEEEEVIGDQPALPAPLPVHGPLPVQLQAPLFAVDRFLEMCQAMDEMRTQQQAVRQAVVDMVNSHRGQAQEAASAGQEAEAVEEEAECASGMVARACWQGLRKGADFSQRLE